jgi:phage terminase large subunit-like protein
MQAARCPSAEDRAALYRETCVRLVDFVRTFWGAVEPAEPFQDNWHIGAVCEFLEAWHAREFRFGVLNLPPGTGKSLLVDVFLQAWVWSKRPGYKFMNCAFDIDVCMRDALKVQTILLSPVYRLAWPGTQLRDGASGARSDVWTKMGGYRFSTSPAGKGGLGRHFHDVSVNDPVNPKHVLDVRKSGEFGAGLAQAQSWIDTTMITRRADPARFGCMLTMQRLVQDDPAGKAIDRGWEHLCLPMRYEPKAHWIRGERSAQLDQRTKPGELLHPGRYTEAAVQELETGLADHSSAQLQQNPIPRTGGLLEEQHLVHEWLEPPKHGYWIQVWDFAAKGTLATHSAIHGALWCSAECDTWYDLTNTIADRDRGEEPTRVLVRGPKVTRYFLMDEVWGIWTVPESERQFETTQEMPTWQAAAAVIIEEKAAGTGIIQRYSKKFPSVVAFHEINEECAALAVASKIDRHRANLPEYHAGRVLLPPWKRTVPDPIDGRDGPGPDAFRRELLAFPRGARDDRVDTSSMALARLTQGVSVYYAAVRELAKQARQDEEWE